MDQKAATKILSRIQTDLAKLAEMLEVRMDEGIDDLQPRSQKQVEALEKKGICLWCGKVLPPDPRKQSRGIHEKCYQKLRRGNKLESAAAAGYCLPPDKPGPKAAPLVPGNPDVIAAKNKLKLTPTPPTEDGS